MLTPKGLQCVQHKRQTEELGSLLLPVEVLLVLRGFFDPGFRPSAGRPYEELVT